MFGHKRILRVAAVLFVALAAGQLVETLRPTAAAGRSAAKPPGNVASLTAAGPVVGTVLPESASLVDGSGVGLPKLTGITSVAAVAEARGPTGCDIALDLAPAPGAMIELSLSAPCNRSERVVIRHSGLSFTALTAADGTLDLQLPALEPDALVATYFGGSGIALAKVEVPEATSYVRFAVQIPFPAQFDLRADEGGQVFVGSSFASNEGSLRRIAPLGTVKVAEPLLAQVYTFPTDGVATPDLTVELRITPDTCGRTLPVETLLARGGDVTVSKFSVSVPLCGTSGDILLLKNLLRDLTLAAPR
ncbi:MAG: hypothetical protein C0524_07630 [Rhodobacter sp.]|nr:hypothetical protein [Rhodobacter sp.]